jgi:hypothetical protein
MKTAMQLFSTDQMCRVLTIDPIELCPSAIASNWVSDAQQLCLRLLCSFPLSQWLLDQRAMHVTAGFLPL